MDNKEIDEAKLQVQGQMAAQYIQEVMQVCSHLSHPLPPIFPPPRPASKPLPGPFVSAHSRIQYLISFRCLPCAYVCVRVWRVQKVTDKCFAKCVTRPGAKLDDSEKV